MTQQLYKLPLVNYRSKIAGPNSWDNKVDRSKAGYSYIIAKHKKVQFQEPKSKRSNKENNANVTEISPPTLKGKEPTVANELKTMKSNEKDIND